MSRRSPRSRRKATARKLPQKPRVRTAPGRTRATPARPAHAKQGARGSASRTPPRKRAVRAVRPAAARRSRAPDPVRVAAVLEQLRELYPDATCALTFRTPLQLLIATILSAQCTDERVNQVTPGLFATWPDAAALTAADPADLEQAIRSTGFFRMKAKAIREACADIVAKHGGEVPRTLEALVELRGVGRKTANVVLGNAFGIASGIVVDTHVSRLAQRLGLTGETDPVKIEFALMPLVPRDEWTLFSHWLILHGRRVCNARKPRCGSCTLRAHCPRVGVTVSA